MRRTTSSQNLHFPKESASLECKKKNKKKEQNIITQAAAIACNIKLPLKSILYYIQFLNPTSQSVVPPMAQRVLEIIWPLNVDDECSRDRPCVTVGCKHPRGMQGDTCWLSRPRAPRASPIAIKKSFGHWVGPMESWAGSGSFLDDWQAFAASRAAVRSDHTSAASVHIWKWHISFWPQRSSLAEVAKVFILAPPYDQMWHYWEDSDSHCSNVQSHSVVMKVLFFVPTLKTTLTDPSFGWGLDVWGGGSHVCLLLPSAQLFVCLVLNISTLALLFCVGVESDPHLQGFSLFLSLSFFRFPLRLQNLNLRQNIHAPPQVCAATVKRGQW